MDTKNILVVDDEEDIRDFMEAFFEEREINVTLAENGEVGLAKFQEGTYDLVISDMMMPKMIGVQMLARILEIKPEQKIIMMTGVKEDTMVEKAKSLGCQHYLTKPVRLEELEQRVQECLGI